MRAQRGNILFLILLAVILFAALSYAVTSSMRGGGTNASPEKARVAAAEIINYATLMEQAITRMRMTGGCDIGQISFENATVNGYTNNNTPLDNHCKIFHPSGGGMAWKTPDTAWLVDTTTANSYTYAGNSYGVFRFPNSECVTQIGSGKCTGLDTEKELIVSLRYLQKDVCDAINQNLGQTTNSTPETCSPDGAFTDLFTGSFLNGGQSQCSNAVGKLSYCLNSDRSGYTFYHVLIAR